MTKIKKPCMAYGNKINDKSRLKDIDRVMINFHFMDKTLHLAQTELKYLQN